MSWTFAWIRPPCVNCSTSISCVNTRAAPRYCKTIAGACVSSAMSVLGRHICDAPIPTAEQRG
eukprot:8316269-Lingulodinium_polyedra.AAC.1